VSTGEQPQPLLPQPPLQQPTARLIDYSHAPPPPPGPPPGWAEHKGDQEKQADPQTVLADADDGKEYLDPDTGRFWRWNSKTSQIEWGELFVVQSSSCGPTVSTDHTSGDGGQQHTSPTAGAAGCAAGGVAATAVAIAVGSSVADCEGLAQAQACTATSCIIGATIAGTTAAPPSTAPCDVRTEAAQLSAVADGWSQSIPAPIPACAAEAQVSDTFGSRSSPAVWRHP
jgi:hypothetical protein